jgi:hypothetical protein
MDKRWRSKIGWLPVAILAVAAALLFVVGRHHGLSDEVVGGLGGSLIGAAAILSGVLFDRQQRRADDLLSKAEDRRKLKAIIAAELVNVAAGLIGAKNFLDSAVHETSTGRSVPSADLFRHLPRPMPFTDNLGVELLLLSQREVDVLATLCSNLAISKMSIGREIERGETVGWLACKKIQGGVRHDMAILAEAFTELAPERKLTLGGNGPELASTLLARMSRQDKD